MPTPLPDLFAPLLPPPDRKEVVHITRVLKTAMQPSDGLTELQGHVLTAITASMTGFEIELDELEPLGPEEDLGHMILDTPDREVAERVIVFGDELCVPSDTLHKATPWLPGRPVWWPPTSTGRPTSPSSTSVRSLHCHRLGRRG